MKRKVLHKMYSLGNLLKEIYADVTKHFMKSEDVLCVFLSSTDGVLMAEHRFVELFGELHSRVVSSIIAAIFTRIFVLKKELDQSSLALPFFSTTLGKYKLFSTLVKENYLFSFVLIAETDETPLLKFSSTVLPNLLTDSYFVKTVFKLNEEPPSPPSRKELEKIFEIEE